MSSRRKSRNSFESAWKSSVNPAPKISAPWNKNKRTARSHAQRLSLQFAQQKGCWGTLSVSCKIIDCNPELSTASNRKKHDRKLLAELHWCLWPHTMGTHSHVIFGVLILCTEPPLFRLLEYAAARDSSNYPFSTCKYNPSI